MVGGKDFANVDQAYQAARDQNWRLVATRIGEFLPGNAPAPVRHSLQRMQAQANQLRSLEKLHTALRRPWEKPPEVNRLKEALADHLRLTGDSDRTTALQRMLVAKAIKEGFLKAAKQLRPLGEMRDVKITGEGGELSPNQPKDKPSGRAQAFPKPEGPPQSVRPSPKEPLVKGLPPWEGKPAAAQASGRQRPQGSLRQQVAACLAVQRNILLTRLQILRDFSRDADRQEGAGDDLESQETPLKVLPRLLDRKLTAAERILVLQMHRQGKNPKETAAILRKISFDRATPRWGQLPAFVKIP